MTAADGVSQADVAFCHLRSSILTLSIAPGEWLTERQLASDLALGLTPVREALLRLTVEGLVTRIPRRGYMVTPLTAKTIDDFFQVWRFVGPEIARLALAKLDDDEHQSLTHEILDLHRRARGPTEHLEAGRRTFERFVDIAGNDLLRGLFARLQAEMTRIYMFFLMDERDQVSVDYLAHVFAAGDSEAVVERIRGFIDETHYRTLESVKRPASRFRMQTGNSLAGIKKPM